jgi:hypothetical protein
MPNEAEIRQLAREALHKQRLPRERPDRTWGGPGIGVPCAVCQKPVSRDELEYEIQFSRDGADPSLDRFHLHLRCFAAWEMERTKPGNSAESRPVK